jgi:hypothetical protein
MNKKMRYSMVSKELRNPYYAYCHNEAPEKLKLFEA